MKFFLHNILFATFMFGLTACAHVDSSNKDKTPLAMSDYTVTFEGLGALSGESALSRTLSEKQSTLGAENFAVVVVDLAGNVLEKLTLNPGDIKKNTDGTWVVSLPGKQRTDRLIVVDLIKPVALTLTRSIHQEGLVFTPTSDTHVNLTAGTTVAYKHFIEALGGVGQFASVNDTATSTQEIDSIKSLAVNR
jgi:hypothetical protein